ncbi:MAG: hypothetical protein H6667_21425 [Ardenticatenaceae bacterium]|nr:hypothetical protein [Ardenticatenaceae bacterium]
MLNSERFVDSSPRQVYGTLLMRGEYLCSASTMYRILRQNAEVHERRNQKRHPVYKENQNCGHDSNQVVGTSLSRWGLQPHVYYYMYTILDIFSRYVVGYLIAQRELHHWPNSWWPTAAPNRDFSNQNSWFSMLTGAVP